MDGPPLPKRQRRAARGMPGLPPEVVAAIGEFCCRSSLDALMLTSTQIRDGCKGVSKPWPTSRGCRLVKTICLDSYFLGELSFDDWDLDVDEIYDERTLDPKKLVVLRDSVGGASFLFLQNAGSRTNTYQVWSKEWGLIYNDRCDTLGMKPAITPPLGECDSNFVILPSLRDTTLGGDAPEGASKCIRAVEMRPPLRAGGLEAMPSVQSIPLPCREHLHTFKCAGGGDNPCLIFMDRGEDAVKLCRLTLGEQNGNAKQLRISAPEILASDPSRTAGRNTRRGSLAIDSKKGFIAFSYDFLDTCINIYDMKRKVSVAVPIPKGAGWIRDAEFSPDGKMLVVAHCTYQDGRGIDSCAISVYDCSDIDRIECIPQRPPKLFRVREHGWNDDISFSPKGSILSFRWYPKGGVGNERVGMIDLAPLKDADDGSTISLEILSDVSQWERFASS